MIRHAPDHLDRFLALCGDCETVQHEVLTDILRRAGGSAIGRRFGFDAIDGYRTFSTAVPPLDWSDHEGYAQSLADGDADQLFAGVPDYFICTSGTTGAVKIIPESAAGRQAKSITTRLRLEAIARHAPAVMQGKMLPLVNNAIEGYTRAGIPYGSASGVTLATAPESVRARLAFPIEILDVGYSDSLDYLIMRFALEQDVRGIFGNNAGRIEQLCRRAEAEAERIIDDIESGSLSCARRLPEATRASLLAKCAPNPARAETLRQAYAREGRFTPRAYWPECRVIACWLSGSVGRYVDPLRGWFDRTTIFFDVGYGATEGKFNIPLAPSEPAGPLAIHAAFYEFKPLDSGDGMLRAHELKAGGRYELYVTSYSGLYRYGMHDIVRVAGFTGTTPHIVFERKAGDVLNICGEKVAASTLIPIVASAVGDPLVHWCVVGDGRAKRYHFCLELPELPADAGVSARAYAEAIEQALNQDTLIYPIFRGQNLLQPAAVSLMRPGWRESLYTERTRNGQSRAQVKLPLVYEAVPLERFEAVTSAG